MAVFDQLGPAEVDQVHNYLRKNKPGAFPALKLSASEQRSNCIEYVIPGLFALAAFPLALLSLMKIGCFQKTVQRRQKSVTVLYT